MTMDRRAFLGLAAGGAATGAAAWAGLLALGDDGRRARPSGPTRAAGPAPAEGVDAGRAPTFGDRILVVVQLSGGNDALNTLVPTAGAYRDARPSLAITERGLVALPGEDGFSLHPALAPLAAQWKAGRLAALASIGFEGAGRSHFEATDAWTAGAPGRSSRSGWLGRWLDATIDDDPDPLRAIAIGSGAASALRAERSPITAIVDPDRFSLRAPRGVDDDVLAEALVATAVSPDAEDAAVDPLVAAARASIPDAVAAVRRLAKVGVGAEGSADAAAKPASGEGGTYAGGDVTDGLDLAAQLIGEQLGTRIVVVGANGFDTHASQADEHQRLLGDLANGIDRFQRTIEVAGLADRVLLVTTSEFGRRVAENGSGGTDHGNGGVQFLVGHGLARAVVVGDLDAARPDDEGDLRPTIDARSLYSVALDWLGGPVTEIVGGRYDTYDLLA